MRLSKRESPLITVPPLLSLDIGGNSIVVDDEGYLLDSDDWSPAVVEAMADHDKLELGDDHWLVINYLRDYYKTYQIAPELYQLQKTLCKSMQDCRWNREYIRKLFPVRGARDACRYAGLPKPLKGACG